MTFPNPILAGDTLDFSVAVSDYPASAGWTLTYSLRGASSIDLVASADGDAYRVQATAATTATWIPDKYSYAAVVAKDADRYTVGSGSLTIAADLTQAQAGYDSRSIAEKALADAEAALASYNASRGMVKKYTIGQRSMEFSTSSEILEIINYWRLRVANEGAAASIANGLGNPRRLRVRFV